MVDMHAPLTTSWIALCSLALVLGCGGPDRRAGGGGGGGGGGVGGGGDAGGGGGAVGGGQGGGGGGEGAGGAAREACKLGNAALCERMYECFTSDQLVSLEREGGFDDASTCAEVVSDAVCPDFAEAATQGTTILHADRTAACEAAMRSTACPDDLVEYLTRLRSLDACAAVFEGTQLHAEPCVVSVECAETGARCTDKGFCTAAPSGEAYEEACSEPTVNDCGGLYCLTLPPNLQNMTGICSAECQGHWDCGEGAKCFRLTEEIKACLSTCDSNADCGGGSVCTAINAEDTVCFVEVPPG